MDVIKDNIADLDGLGQLKAMLAAGVQPPIAVTMGFELTEIEVGVVDGGVKCPTTDI